MTHDERDSRLRHLFHSLRDYDNRRMVPFDRLWPETASAQKKALSRVAWLRLAAVGSALIVLGLIVMVFYPGSQRPAEDTRQWSVLSEWRASTDSLLNGLSTPWSSDTITTVTDSWMDTSSSLTDTTL